MQGIESGGDHGSCAFGAAGGSCGIGWELAHRELPVQQRESGERETYAAGPAGAGVGEKVKGLACQVMTCHQS